MTAYEVVAAALDAPKSAMIASGWRDRSRLGALRFVAALNVGPVTERGLSVCLECNATRPDERVSVSLLMILGGVQRAVGRVDWRGSEHGNTSGMCGTYRGLDAGPTHFHDARLCPDRGRVLEYLAPRNNLPIAVPITPEPQDFAALMDAASVLLNVDNLKRIPTPPWQSNSLFP